MTKILPIKYRSYIDRIKSPLMGNHKTCEHDPIEISDSEIKVFIQRWLFDENYHYVLIYYKNELWLVEKDSSTSYCKKLINYHPLENLFSNKKI